MTERRAIQREHELIAECPVNGICRSWTNDMHKQTVECGHCKDVVIDVDKGTIVYCNFSDRHEG